MSQVAVPIVSFCAHPVLRAEVLAKYPQAKLNETGRQLAGDALVEFLKGYEKALIGLEVIGDSILARLPDLKVISKYGVGLDMVDLEAMKRRGIRMGWTGGVNRRSVAELVIAMAITLLRHVPLANAQLRQGGWHRPAGRQAYWPTEHSPPRPQRAGKALLCRHFAANQRRGWDSNPRGAIDAQRFSRPPRSTTPAPLRGGVREAR